MVCPIAHSVAIESLLAKKRAVLDLLLKLSSTIEETIILVDGNKKIPELNYHQIAVIQGDGLSASIAAASVIAKVFRDQLMNELAETHPQYHWHKSIFFNLSQEIIPDKLFHSMLYIFLYALQFNVYQNQKQVV